MRDLSAVAELLVYLLTILGFRFLRNQLRPFGCYRNCQLVLYPGATGFFGGPGSTGDTGSTGIPGAVGASGFPGQPGQPGFTGQPGSQGLQGISRALISAIIFAGSKRCYPPYSHFGHKPNRSRCTTCTYSATANCLISYRTVHMRRNE